MLGYIRQCVPYTLNFGSSLFNVHCNKLGDASMYFSEIVRKASLLTVCLHACACALVTNMSMFNWVSSSRCSSANAFCDGVSIMTNSSCDLVCMEGGCQGKWHVNNTSSVCHVYP